MSKTQDKRAQRAAERDAFIKARRAQELVMLNAQFKAGLEFYESVKEKLSEEDIAAMEAEKQKFLDKIAKFIEDNGLEGLDEEPQE